MSRNLTVCCRPRRSRLFFEIDLAQDSRNRVFLYQMDRYPGGQFPYAAFFWPALAAASAGEIGSSFAEHFLGFSGDADGDHTPQEPEGATPSKIALELHAVRLRDFTVAQSGVPTLLCTPLALHGAAVADLVPDTVSLPRCVLLELNDCS